jgi:hypothetical protein
MTNTYSYLVDSKDRIAGTASNYTVMLNPPVMFCKKAHLKWVSMPNTIYNICSAVNNYLSFTDDTGLHTLTIPPANYDITSLCSTLQSMMTVLGSQAYLVTYDSSTFKVVFSAIAAFSIQFGTTGSCATVLGFNTEDTVSATTLTGQNAVAFELEFVYIRVHEFSPTINSTSKNCYTYVIPITENGGEVIVYTDSAVFSQSAACSDTVNKLTISLYLRNNEIVDLNGVEWQMLLELEE